MAVPHIPKTVDHFKDTLKCAEASFSSLSIESPATAHAINFKWGEWILGSYKRVCMQSRNRPPIQEEWVQRKIKRHLQGNIRRLRAEITKMKKEKRKLRSLSGSPEEPKALERKSNLPLQVHGMLYTIGFGFSADTTSYRST
jgi:hypothetical protein